MSCSCCPKKALTCLMMWYQWAAVHSCWSPPLPSLQPLKANSEQEEHLGICQSAEGCKYRRQQRWEVHPRCRSTSHWCCICLPTQPANKQMCWSVTYAELEHMVTGATLVCVPSATSILLWHVGTTAQYIMPMQHNAIQIDHSWHSRCIAEALRNSI